jgi:hypothetical protein
MYSNRPRQTKLRETHTDRLTSYGTVADHIARGLSAHDQRAQIRHNRERKGMRNVERR